RAPASCRPLTCLSGIFSRAEEYEQDRNKLGGTSSNFAVKDHDHLDFVLIKQPLPPLGVRRLFFPPPFPSRSCLMSSLTNRGATGAVKTKVQNVNSVYAGKNQLQGGKPAGRNGGLTAIGKASGVVRRMPPPPSLPSLRAESQGQDPDIAIVPQGGTGWSKSETSTSASTVATAASVAASTESKPSVVASPAISGVDMRPAWAKPPTSAAAAAAETTPVAGYPSLASAAATAGEETKASRTWRSSGSMSEDHNQELPARFYEGGNGGARTYQPSRFQGSSDARATQGGVSYGTVAGATSAPVPRHTGADRWSISETREAITEEPPVKKADPLMEPARRNEDSHDYTKRNGGAASDEQQQQSPQPPHHEYRLLKRPAASAAAAAAATPQSVQQPPRAAPATLADLNRVVEDEDDELRMTKLSKPATRVMKRVGPGQQSDVVAADLKEVQKLQPKEDRKQQPQQKSAASTPAAASAATSQEKSGSEDTRTARETSPVQSPAENIWEKRKEERASAERERVSAARHLRGNDSSLQQHFPSVAEAATMRVDKDAARKPADAEFARVALRARRGPVVNDVRALQDDGVPAAAPPPPRPPRQQQQMQQRRRPEGEEYGGYEYERRRDYDDRRQYDGTQQRGYDKRDNYRSDYNRQEYSRDEEQSKREEYGRDDRRDGGENEESENRGGRREYPPPTRTGRGGGQSRGGGQRGNGYPLRGGGGRGGPQRTYEKRPRDDEEDKESHQPQQDESSEQQLQPVQQRPSDQLSWRRNSQDETEQPQAVPKEKEDDADSAPRRRYNPQQSQPRVTMTRGVRGGRGAHAVRGSTRGVGNGTAQANRRQTRDDEEHQQQRPRKQRDEGEDATAAHDKRHGGAPRPTRGLYAPRGARRGGYGERHARGDEVREGDESAAAAAPEDGSSSNLLQATRETRLKSPVASSEGHEEWETASESSQKDERKMVPAAKSNGHYAAAPSTQHVQQQPKNGQPPASRQHNSSSNTTTHAKREGGMRRGERSEKQQSQYKKETTAAGRRTRKGEESEEESVDRLAGLDLHDERRVVIVDDLHPASSTHIEGTEAADFEEVLSKKQKRARAEEEKARAEAEERRLQREKERAERAMHKKEKRAQANEAAKARAADVAARKKNEKMEEKSVTTVWNSAQPEARVALEKSEAEAAAAVSVDAAAAAAGGLVLPSPIARPRTATKKPAVELPPSASSKGVQDKYEFMYDEEAAALAAAAAAAAAQTDGSDGRITVAPSETGSAHTNNDDLRKMTENVNLCKDLWSGEVSEMAGDAAVATSVVSPLIVHHHHHHTAAAVHSAHHSPSAAAAA
ncbi:hypothetical protein PFISCL1PPCAC_26252, partial [Pristionchus fissidentatus]